MVERERRVAYVTRVSTSRLVHRHRYPRTSAFSQTMNTANKAAGKLSYHYQARLVAQARLIAIIDGVATFVAVVFTGWKVWCRFWIRCGQFPPRRKRTWVNDGVRHPYLGLLPDDFVILAALLPMMLLGVDAISIALDAGPLLSCALSAFGCSHMPHFDLDIPVFDFIPATVLFSAATWYAPQLLKKCTKMLNTLNATTGSHGLQSR
jgi:hypothetical protein